MNSKPLTWPPHTITEIEPGPRTAFIGRAASLFTSDGIEVIILCRNLDDLTLVGDSMTGNTFNPEVVYKATLIHTEGVTVETQADEPVQAVIPFDAEDEPAAPPSESPVRDDGAQVVQYKQQAVIDETPAVPADPAPEPAAQPVPVKAKRGRKPKVKVETPPVQNFDEDDEI